MHHLKRKIKEETGRKSPAVLLRFIAITFAILSLSNGAWAQEAAPAPAAAVAAAAPASSTPTNLAMAEVPALASEAPAQPAFHFPPEQTNVAVEVRIVEVLYDRSKALGVDWLFNADTKDGKTPGEDVNAVEGAIEEIHTRFGVFNGTGPDITGGFRVSATFDAGHAGEITAVIDALAANSTARILSEPLIVTTSGKPASIQTGMRFPYLNVQITAYRDVIVTNFIDTGVSLKVLPTIEPGKDTILLDVQPSVSFITRFISVPTSLGTFSEPAISERSANTIVRVRNGYSFVIGGLFQTQYFEQKKKVPGLGSVPLFGLAFSNTNISDFKTELLIFIRPLILGPYDLYNAERNLASIYGLDPEGVSSVFALSDK